MDDPQREIKEWLAKKLTHGVAVRVSAETGISGDKLTRSKELEATDPKKRRQISPQELRLLARFFRELPPGYEGVDWLDDLPPLQNTTELSIAIGAAIRQARRQLGMVIRQVAEATGVDATDVGAWEAGRDTPNPEQLKIIADFLRIDGEALAGGTLVPTGDELLGDATFVSGEIPRHSGPRDVELLGVVAAGDDGDFEFNGKVADYRARPKGLIGRPGVFALEIISDSMYPAYRKNDPIFCDRSEPQIGDDVVIETFPENGAKVGKAFVKRLIRRTKSEIVVEQFNPRKEITFNPYEIKHVWRVVPNKELHGY